MNYVSAQPQALIHGAFVDDIRISCSRGMSEQYTLGGGSFVPISLGRPEIEVELQLLVTGGSNDDVVVQLERWYELGQMRSRWVALGEGLVCPYCGDYNPAGRAKCWRCGGETERQPLVKVEEFPFLLRSYEYDMLGAFGDYPAALVSLNMVAEHPVYDRHLDMLSRPSGVRLEVLPNDCLLDTKHYLCQYCGSVVDSGKQCPNCGGQRLPWSEVVKIDHECLYCGRKTTGGIVCPGCAASISGQALRQYVQ